MTIRTHIKRTGLVAALTAAAMLLFPATSMAKKKGRKHHSPPPITNPTPVPGFGSGYGNGHFGPGYVNTGPGYNQGQHGAQATFNKRQLRKWRKAQARKYVKQVNTKLFRLNKRMQRAYRQGRINRHEMRRFSRQQTQLKRSLRRAKRDGWVTWAEQASINNMLWGINYGVQVAAAF